MPEPDLNFIDGHVHTEYCRHARGRMEEYVEVAVAKGLPGLIFLEHLEIGINYPQQTWLDLEEFFLLRAEVERLADLYRGKIKVGIGVEAGWNPERGKDLAEFIRAGEWDRVGLSYHFLDIGGEHFNLVSRRQFNLDALAAHGRERVFDRYLDGIVEALEVIPADTLCHLDAPLRYLPGEDMAISHADRLDRIFGLIANRGVALEVNCSGFSIRGEPFPSYALLERARAAGVRFTIGSDAHRPEDVGRHFLDLPDWVLSNLIPNQK